MKGARKQRISDAFGAAATRYDDHAAPQRRSAAMLADMVSQHLGSVSRILEIGCGTGFLTRQIQSQWPGATMIVTDIAPDMVGHVAQSGDVAGMFVTMDGEQPAFDGPSFDLIVSNLAFQWFDDLDQSVHRLVGLLRPGGSLFFSTMGDGSFARWRSAHHGAGVVAGVPVYMSRSGLHAIVSAHGDAFTSEAHIELACPTAQDLLSHLKAIGAGVPPAGRAPLKPAQLKRVMRAYDEAGGDGDAYHILLARVSAA